LFLGPVTVGSVTLSLNAMLLSLFVAVVGLQLFLIGVIAQSLYDGTDHKRRRWLAAFAYNRTFVAAAAVFMVGTIPVIRFLVAFIDQDYRFTDTLIDLNHQAIFGLFLMICGILVFVSMLVIQAIGLYASANGAGKA
jgi:hypothetical protein